MDKITFINCKGTSDNFIILYNCLSKEKSIESNDNFTINVLYENVNRNNFLKNAIYLSESKKLKKVDKIQINNQNLILNIDICGHDYDSFDVLDFKYLLLLNNYVLSAENIYINIIVDNEKGYFKFSSFLFLEAIKNNNICVTIKNKENLKVNKIAKVVSKSKEWITPLYISNKDWTTFNFLSGLLFDENEVKAMADIYINNKLDEKFDSNSNNIDIVLKDYYREIIISTLAFLDNDSRELFLEKIYNMTALTLILIFIQARVICDDKVKIKKNILKEIINNSYDYSECILQIIENIISHTYGGYLFIRANDNFEKLNKKYNITKPKSKEQNSQFVSNDDNKKLSWLLNISIIDISNNSILDNIKNKYNEINVNLEDIFVESDTNNDYSRILEKDENVIHHYGLRLFSNLVSQMNGSFRIISSAKTKVDTTNKKEYWIKESDYIKDKKLGIVNHMPGTEYDIIIPFGLNIDEDKEFDNFNVPVSPVLLNDYNRKNILLDNNINYVLNDGLNEIISKYSNFDYQKRKETSIDDAAFELSKRIKNKIEDDCNYKIVYLIVSNFGTRINSRIEVLAKIILKMISLVRLNKEVKFVLYGIPNNYLNIFVRQYALFYMREKGCDYMDGVQLYVVSDDYNVEVLFSGANLHSILDYNMNMILNSGLSSNITDILEHVVKTRNGNLTSKYKSLQPISFDLLPRIEKKIDYTQSIISPNKKWFHKKLENVLLNDIHNSDLGCCIYNTHVRINQIHLDRFYEAQLLFGNSYWCNIFSDYLVNVIKLDKELSNKSKRNEPLLIVGYETYSEPLLFLLKSKLFENGYKDVTYVVYENEKYITSKNKSSKNFRYLSEFKEARGVENLRRTRIVFLSCISSTLSLLKYCLNSTLKDVLPDYDSLYKKGIVIIQVDGDSKNSEYHKEFISIERANDLKSLDYDEYDKVLNDNCLDFLNEKKCNFLISVPAIWSKPCDCKQCYPENYLNEVYLIETNETSTVPMLLIQLKNKEPRKYKYFQVNAYEESFLNDDYSRNYLYYSHIERGGNHYQYYIKTSNYIFDLLNKKDKYLFKWFNQLRELEKINANDEKINIIVCPAHFSNETFASAINKYVFDGKSYIINFDVKKEYRQTFETNYINYKNIIDIIQKYNMNKIEVNFYFVDDQIITGETYYRTRSLITSLLNGYGYLNSKIKVNLFKAIIVFLNRNSVSSICNYFNLNRLIKEQKVKYYETVQLPYYRFLDLYTPSLRSYGDSCPICSKVTKMEAMIEEAGLTSSSNYWNGQKEKYLLKPLDKVKAFNDEEKYKGFRRLKCSELVWKLIKNVNNNEIVDSDYFITNIFEPLSKKFFEQYNECDSIEYLISLLKIISRPFISYREVINTAALKYLLKLYSVIVDKKEILSNDNESIYFIVKKLYENKSEVSKLKYDLFRTIISCLCDMGSCWFINIERLISCLSVGKELEKNANNKYFEEFEDYLCLQIKKSFYATKDKKIRMEKFDKILNEKLEELLHRRKI